VNVLKFKRIISIALKVPGSSEMNLPLNEDVEERYRKDEEIRILLTIKKDGDTVAMRADEV
jgi:hypothetical protein